MKIMQKLNTVALSILSLLIFSSVAMASALIPASTGSESLLLMLGLGAALSGMAMFIHKRNNKD